MHPRRSSRYRSLLAKKKLQALLISDLSNIRYLTGASVSAGCVLLTSGSVMFFVDGRYLESVRETLGASVSVYPIVEFKGKLVRFKRVGFEAEHVTVARLERMRSSYPSVRFIPTSGLIEVLRRSKSPLELRAIQRACSLTKKVLRSIPSMLHVGISERELAQKIDALSARLGAERMAFDTIVAFGSNTSHPHHHPTRRTLTSTDIVQIDMGVKVDGYCSDYSRVFWMGQKTPEQKIAYKALLEAKKSAEKSIAVGVSNRALDQIARTVLLRYGYDAEFCHSLGHGLGLDIHEAPTLSTKAPLLRLRKNEVITIEPGLYFEGAWGMRVEDTIVVR